MIMFKNLSSLFESGSIPDTEYATNTISTSRRRQLAYLS